MLMAFTLVIVIGVGGMLAVFWLAAQHAQRNQAALADPSPERVARAEARRLARLYDRTGSWDNAEIRLKAIERELRRSNLARVMLLDANGVVVTSYEALPPRPPLTPPPPRPPERIVLPPTIMPQGFADGERSGRERPVEVEAFGMGVTVRSVPILLRGDQVGTLVLVYHGALPPESSPAFLARGIFGAGLALTVILLGLAAFFSGRISTPLRQLDAAARAMAAGDLHVRVRPGHVREVADLARSFNQMADALADADRQRRQLTADVAHELRTPLSIIKGRLEGIQDGVYPADAEQIAALLDKVTLLERLVEDLRLLALAEAGQLALYPEPVEPARLLYDAQRSFAHQASERGIDLRAEVGDLPELVVDPLRIAQVLGNLVSNALRYTPRGGEVVLAASVRQGEVVFEVRDSGVGIAPEDLPRIFDRFYRADPSRTRASGGAGLGLAIARRIVEAHAGRIWAESAPGQGTTIRFALPLPSHECLVATGRR